MDAVMKLAEALRNNLEIDGLQDELSKMSSGDLADILRNFEKTAGPRGAALGAAAGFVPGAHLVGGYHMGRQEEARAVKEKRKARYGPAGGVVRGALASLAGPLSGAYMGHRIEENEEKLRGKKKNASAEERRRAGKRTLQGAAEGVAGGMLGGAAVGGAQGVYYGAKINRGLRKIPGAAIGGLMGIGQGAAKGVRLAPITATGGAIMGRSKKKKASVEEGSQTLLQLADSWGRELAKEAAPIMSMGQKLVGGAMKAAITQPTATRALVGAGVGAAGGAIAGGPNHRLSGAVGGAAVGGLAGAGANRGAMALGSMNNRVGRYAGGALKQVAKQSPTVATGTGAALNAAQQMQMNRMAQGGVSRYMRRQTANVGTKLLPAPG